MLLSLVQKHVPMRKVGNEYHGPCPKCGTSNEKNPHLSDRFTVKGDDEHWFCRNCGSGDLVSYLRVFEGKSCPEAHEELGRKCESTTCPVKHTCRVGRGEGAAPRRRDERRDTPALPEEKKTEFHPDKPQTPQEIWQEHAEKLVNYAHEQLINTPDQLAYLAGRGLDLEYIKTHRFGWLARDEYRARVAWGLPAEFKDGKPKKLWLPKGIVIPTYADGVIHRIRIRKHELRGENDIRYYWVPGSGNDVVILNPTARAFVVVEADLDAHLVNCLAGDLVGAVPLGTASANPREGAYTILSQALCILVALDYDPGQDKNGNYMNPGGKSSQKWFRMFPRAKRWPVVGAKDPGDAFKAGLNIRNWVIAGLPPAMTINLRQKPKDQAPQAEAPAVQETPAAPASEAKAFDPGQHVTQIKSHDGRPIYYTDHQATYDRLAAEGKIVVNSREIEVIRTSGATKEQAAVFLNAKEIFGGKIAGQTKLSQEKAV